MDNKYVIATGYSRANLCEHVSKYIENGWHPIGGMVIDFNEEEDHKVEHTPGPAPCHPVGTCQSMSFSSGYMAAGSHQRRS